MVSSLIKAARLTAKEAKDIRKQTKEALQKPKEKPVDVSQGTGQQKFTKTKKAYKLFVQGDDNKLYPLFVDAKKEVPQGKYLEANFPEEAFTAPNGKMYVPSKGAKRSKGEEQKGTGDQVAIPDEETRKKLIEKGYITDKVKRTDKFPYGRVTAVAARPGWHSSQLPVATHIGPANIKVTKKEVDKLLKAGITPEAIKKRGNQFYVKRRAEDHVFAEVDMADDVNYQSILAQQGKTDINDRVPVGGSYKYVDGQADSKKWVVGGNMRVNKVLSREETKLLQKELGVKDLPYKKEIEDILGKKFSKGGLLEGDSMEKGVDDYLLAETNEMNVGGTPKKSLESQQLEMFGDIGMAKSPAKRDPISGNEIPKASTAEEVRDDIPAQLSEGEFVLPADVVRYHGLEKLMKLRQQAKQGINTMDKMGQLGNSEEATMPDDLPFNINDINMAEGGLVNMQQGGAVNTGTYQVPSNIYTQPSNLRNYQQSVAPFKPFVPPARVPITRVGQTQTGRGPTFEQLIPTVGGKRVTKEYRNEAGQRLFIPFINDKPIYPIPEGYTEYVTAQTPTDTKPTQDTTTGTGTRTTRVQDSGDDSADTTVRSTTVTGLGAGKPLDTNFETQSPDEAKRNLDQMREGDRGLSVLAALEKARGSAGLSKAIQQAGAVLPSLMAPGAMTIPMLGTQMVKEETFNPIEAFKEIGEPNPTALNNILGGYGYNAADFDITDDPAFEGDTMAVDARNEALSKAIYGKGLAEVTQELGVAPTFRRGKNPGDIDIETGNTYDKDGQAGGAYQVGSYASFAAFREAMKASAQSKFYGSKATAREALRRNPNNKKARAYLDYFDKDDKKDKKPEVKTPTRTDDKKEETKTVTSDGAFPTKDTPSGDTGIPTGIDDYGVQDDIYSAFQDTTPQVDYSSDDGGDSGDPGGDSGGGGAGGDSSDMGFSTAKGGFIKKKNLPKAKKKMKRGGLASKK